MSHPSHSKTDAAYNPKLSQVSQVSQVIPLSPSFAKYAQFAVSDSIFAKFAQFAVRYFTVFDNLRSIHGNLCKKTPRAAQLCIVNYALIKVSFA